MAEHLSPQNQQYFEQIIANQRKKIATFLAASSFLFMGTINNEGFRLLPSKIKLESKSFEELINPFDGNAYVLTESFLKDDGLYEWSHRAGNTIESIDEAVRKGANIIDMDLNDADGELYGEHGIMLKEKILGSDFTLVFDPIEVKLETKSPTKFEDLIKHIASHSTQERPLAVNTEFKFGPFHDETLEKMIDILFKYQVPAIIRPGKGKRLETIRAIYDRKNLAE